MLKAKLLADLIEKLNMLDDESSEDEGSEKGTGGAATIIEVSKEKPKYLDEMMEDDGMPEDGKALDSAEHDHSKSVSCGPECPVRLAVKRRMGKE